MAVLGREPDWAEEYLEVADPGGVVAEDKLINTKGASLNYVSWEPDALGALAHV